MIMVATNLAQAAESILLALVLYGFYRIYKRNYLMQWSMSWWALCVYLLGSSAAMYLMRGYLPLHPLRIMASTLSLIAGYWQIAFLIFGANEIATGKACERRTSRIILVILFFLALVIEFAYSALQEESFLRLFIRVGIKYGLAGLAFIITSIIIWRILRKRKGIGHRLVSIAFFLYGLEQLHYYIIIAMQLPGAYKLSYDQYLGFFDFFLQLIMGLGMVIWFLEEERDRVMQASSQIEYLAYHDNLTRLPNQKLLLDRLIVALAQSEHDKEKTILLYLNLDRLKVINDSLGHSIGDKILIDISERLQNAISPGSTVARMGGDDFCVLLPRVVQDEDASKMARKLQQVIRSPIKVHNQELFITTSIGISIYPRDAEDAETLLKHAATAMNNAKEHGGDNYQFFVPTMTARVKEQLSIETSLRHALTRNEFVLYFQPIINIKTNKIEATEALIRWQHPERGLIFPREFLYHAEVTGIIDIMGLWVMHTACQQTRIWQEMGFPNLSISMNLCARPFRHPELVAQVANILKQTRLHPNFLQIEITETIALHNTENTYKVLNDLKKLGVKLTIDDFGTGYSSLSYLRNFPIDVLKIDLSFVKDLTVDPVNVAISEAIINLAHSLNIEVVAEGVETNEQRTILALQNCDKFQGFLFSKAEPPAVIQKLLLSQKSFAPKVSSSDSSINSPSPKVQ